ncbi:hypothetical protein [Pseudoalteromonas luteoviolacea]|uniref:Uncharacterized protein n=1 Tax=Pseudoalteromonas luteoviolacea S4054 TaxID=1129367 RepID=A0A0F6AFW6_9GAMM|nr:hypothetical protein [Pseudoalteromonas luteoviolacea]AOT08198.1 hypothetical protein S4054249_10235 [Pseudoalteromonas luteoviolacea]AOT13115.1 hypothetical protein S40542_10235 [Pseudoalteromonas luteoviolacea]AOT18027.1 hypothetical protein S4054_10230 [Pseudoalteromonas luteoviolacea]KKE84696.1 hypothetical protein N479_07830 [Pseudoalteromonas luteoviolacea S4054]KZN74423.1 hypothetical protein N481_00820 [Pseudoalteromonas luteoviolacea S4047-1]
MKKLLLSLLLIPSLSHAVGNISAVNIESIYVRESRTDIYLKQPTNISCANKQRLTILNGEYPNSDAMLSLAIAAHASGKKITAYVGVCHDGLGKVTAINMTEH